MTCAHRFGVDRRRVAGRPAPAVSAAAWPRPGRQPRQSRRDPAHLVRQLAQADRAGSPTRHRRHAAACAATRAWPAPVRPRARPRSRSTSISIAGSVSRALERVDQRQRGGDDRRIAAGAGSAVQSGRATGPSRGPPSPSSSSQMALAAGLDRRSGSIASSIADRIGDPQARRLDRPGGARAARHRCRRRSAPAAGRHIDKEDPRLNVHAHVHVYRQSDI